jgi:hypothetical protein
MRGQTNEIDKIEEYKVGLESECPKHKICTTQARTLSNSTSRTF